MLGPDPIGSCTGSPADHRIDIAVAIQNGSAIVDRNPGPAMASGDLLVKPHSAFGLAAVMHAAPAWQEAEAFQRREAGAPVRIGEALFEPA